NHVTAAEEQQRGLDIDLQRANNGRPCGVLIDTGQRVGHNELAQLFDKAMIAPDVVIAFRSGRLKTRSYYVTVRQQIPELLEEIASDDSVAFRILRHLNAQDIVQC